MFVLGGKLTHNLAFRYFEGNAHFTISQSTLLGYIPTNITFMYLLLTFECFAYFVFLFFFLFFYFI